MKKWYLLIVLLSLLGFESTVVAQYQQYPPPTSLLSRANTWTGAQTFDDVTINGDCVGFVPTAFFFIFVVTLNKPCFPRSCRSANSPAIRPCQCDYTR